MKLIKTYIIKIIYEYGNRFGIELPSLQVVQHAMAVQEISQSSGLQPAA